VISTEVAGHLPKKKSQVFVRNLTQSAKRYIFFTAAHPGQWGDGHINCQSREYWIEIFRRQGWKYNENLHREFRLMLDDKPEILEQQSWLKTNLMIFVLELIS
jgi:hypothetical protein